MSDTASRTKSCLSKLLDSRQLDSGEKAETQVLEWARQEGLEGAIAFFLVSESLGSEQAKEAVMRHFCQVAGYLERLRELDRLFASRQLQGIVTKGAALSLSVYSDQLGSRELSDIDILVKDSAMPLVREALEADGYSVRLDSDMGYVRKGYYLDLHTALMGRIEEAYKFDTDLAWKTKVPLGDEHIACATLDPSFHFCYLAAHGMKHGFSRLKWLLDLALLISECDPQSLRAMAVRTNSLETVSVAMAANDQIFGVTPPEAFQRDIQNLGFVEKIFVKKIVERTLPEEAGKLLAVWGAKGPAKKAKLVKQLLSVEGETLPDRGKRVLGALSRILKRD